MSKFTYTVRSDGRLMKKVTINGKPIYLYSDDPKDLENKYIEVKYQSNNGYVLNKDIKFKNFAQNWLDIGTSGLEERTIYEFKSLLRLHIIPYIGYKKIKDIKLYDVKALLKHLGDKPTTARKTLQLVKRILNEAVDNDIIMKNVAQNLKSPKVVKGERKPLTLEEDSILLNSPHKYAKFFILMRYTGMRKEEIIPLTISDIDLKNKTISINKAVNLSHNQPKVKSTKNKRNRIVPILDIIYPIVTDLVNSAKNNNRILLFVKETDNNMLTDVAVRRHLESLLCSINKNSKKTIKFTCHQLRHSYCTMLYYAGVKIKKAQELMGHSSADMVYNVYTHLDETRENANNLINIYIKESTL